MSDESFGFVNPNISEGVSIEPDIVSPIPNSGNTAGLGPKVGSSINPNGGGVGMLALNPTVSAVILIGVPTVLINGRQAGVIGNPVDMNDLVVKGSSTVFINKLPATRRKDLTMLKRSVVTDANSVYIGD